VNSLHLLGCGLSARAQRLDFVRVVPQALSALSRSFADSGARAFDCCRLAMIALRARTSAAAGH